MLSRGILVVLSDSTLFNLDLILARVAVCNCIIFSKSDSTEKLSVQSHLQYILVIFPLKTKIHAIT